MTNNLLSIIKLIEDHYNIDVPEGNDLPGKVCLNEKLSIEADVEVNINKINSMVYLYELGDPINKGELDYIESKIIKFIITDPFEIAECLELYNITTDVCSQQGLSQDLMLILGNLINLKVDEVEEDFYENMIVVEKRLGKYIPDILKNIINISETYEKNNCNRVSGNTLIMKKLYEKVINKNISHENYKMPDINIGEFIESFQTNMITKIAFLAFLAYIIGKLISTFKVQYKINPDK